MHIGHRHDSQGTLISVRTMARRHRF